MAIDEIPQDLRTVFVAARQRQDFDDLQHETAGIDVGRMLRFPTTEQFEDRKPEAVSERRAQANSRLHLLLISNSAYATLYTQVYAALTDAESATDRALIKAAEALEQAQRKLQDTLSRAARLPDGTRVFKDKDGQVWSEHGARVSEVDAASIHWRGNEPGYEEFTQDMAARDTAIETARELETYRVDILGRFRDRMTDQNAPPSATELDRYKRDIKEKMPAAAEAELKNATPSIVIDASAALQITPRTL